DRQVPPPAALRLQHGRAQPTGSDRVARGQLEPRGGGREIGCEHPHAQLVKRERVARLPGSEVVLLIPIEQRLPAVLHVPSRHVARQRILCVIAHASREVTAIPIGGGALQHRRDFLLRVAERNLRRRARDRDENENDARRTTHGFVLLTWPRERLVETLPRMSKPVVLAAAFLLGGLFPLRDLLLFCLRPRLLGGFLFLFRLLLRLGLGIRARRLFLRYRRRRCGRGRRREHRFHEPRSRPTALRYVRLLKHRIFSYADRCRGVVGGL